MEFADGITAKDPDDLEEGDLSLESHAPRAPRQSRAQMAAPSDGDEAAASKPKQRRGRKRKAVSQPEDEDDEPEDEDDEEWAVDELLGRKVQSEEDFQHDSRFPPGTVLYLVAWESHGEEWENSWEKRENISSDLIRDYERQILESEAADSEGEPENDDGDDELMGVDVDASEVEQVLPVRILKHKYYYDPTGNGGLYCVWVKLKYSDESTTPGFVSSTFLGDSEEGLALLRAYIHQKKSWTIGS